MEIPSINFLLVIFLLYALSPLYIHFFFPDKMDILEKELEKVKKSNQTHKTKNLKISILNRKIRKLLKERIEKEEKSQKFYDELWDLRFTSFARYKDDKDDN